MVPLAAQFALCLCLYDCFLTWVDLSYNALLADLATDETERATMSMVASSFGCVGSVSVFASYVFWDQNDIFYFRLFSGGLALVSAVGFRVSADAIRHSFSTQKGCVCPHQHLLERTCPCAVCVRGRASERERAREREREKVR